MLHQGEPAPRASRALPIAITILSILLWAGLVLLTHAFLVFSQPVAGEGIEYLLLVLVKYYPLIALGALAVGLLLGDARGYVAVTAALLPPVVLGLLVLQNFRSHAVDWDTYESAERKYFELLLEHGLDVNLGDDFGRLIHEAASSDDPEYLRMLIGRGADANATGPALPSPIGTATMFAHYGNALLLLPHSSTENMEEAGEAERAERLERAFPPAADQQSDGRPASD